MLWRCEILNGSVGWAEVEVFGDSFEKAFHERFGSIPYRNVRQLDYINNKWVEVKIGGEWDGH